jgi:zinc-binding alcohol dehydrogenase/oxidoreductase
MQNAMLALQLTDQPDQKVQLRQVPLPTLGPGQALVKMAAASLNHRDEWIRVDKYPHTRPYATLGSDGCGRVEQVADQADRAWVGKWVVINPNLGWGSNPAHQSADYRILGNPTDGTLAEYLAIGVDRLHEKPAHLTPEQAAALGVASLTAHRAVFRNGQVQPGQQVLVTGIGGGVAQFALQFAVAAGAQVWVSSGQDDKISRAVALGALGGANYHQPDWDKQLLARTGGLNLVVDGAGGEGFARLIQLMRPAGRIVFYGATTGLPPALDLYRAFFYQLQLIGSTMGNDDEFAAMLALVAQHQLVPLVDSVRPLAQAVEALDQMRASSQFGKLVISL